MGNHDRSEDIPEECFEAIADLAKIVIKIKDHDWQTFIVSHRPLLCWEGNLSGTIHAFGHCHSSSNPDVEPSFDTELLKFLPKNSWDVGVDNNDYKPISAEEVIERIKEKLNG